MPTSHMVALQAQEYEETLKCTLKDMQETRTTEKLVSAPRNKTFYQLKK